MSVCQVECRARQDRAKSGKHVVEVAENRRGPSAVFVCKPTPIIADNFEGRPLQKANERGSTSMGELRSEAIDMHDDLPWMQ